MKEAGSQDSGVIAGNYRMLHEKMTLYMDDININALKYCEDNLAYDKQ